MIFLDLVFSEENKNYNETLRWKYFVQTIIPFFHFQCFFKHESRDFEVDESRERLASRHLFITDFDTEYSSYFKISAKSSIAVRNKRKDGYVKIHRRLSRKLAFISHEPNLDTLPSSRRVFSIRSPFSLSLSLEKHFRSISCTEPNLEISDHETTVESRLHLTGGLLNDPILYLREIDFNGASRKEFSRELLQEYRHLRRVNCIRMIIFSSSASFKIRKIIKFFHVH